MLAYFGYPQAREDDAARALRAGLGILEDCANLDRRVQARQRVGLSVRIGVHSGTVVISEVGARSWREERAVGQVPNVAARLQSFAKPDTLVISDATLRLVPGLFVVEDLGTPVLKGVTEPLQAYRVLRAAAAREGGA